MNIKQAAINRDIVITARGLPRKSLASDILLDHKLMMHYCQSYIISTHEMLFLIKDLNTMDKTGSIPCLRHAPLEHQPTKWTPQCIVSAAKTHVGSTVRKACTWVWALLVALEVDSWLRAESQDSLFLWPIAPSSIQQLKLYNDQHTSTCTSAVQRRILMIGSQPTRHRCGAARAKVQKVDTLCSNNYGQCLPCEEWPIINWQSLHDFEI